MVDQHVGHTICFSGAQQSSCSGHDKMSAHLSDGHKDLYAIARGWVRGYDYQKILGFCV